MGKPDYMKYDGRTPEPPYDTEAAPSSCTVDSPCSVWAVYAPDGSIATMDTDKEMACAKAVVRHGGRYGWVGMATKGWRCVEGTFTPNARLDRSETAGRKDCHE